MDVLLYDLEQGTAEETIIARCQSTGEPLPPKIANKPLLLPGLELFYRAFFALSTCRYIGMSEGPIPWIAMDRYCVANEIEGTLRDELFHHVRKMDTIYLKHQAKTLKDKTHGGTKGKLQAGPRSNWARGRR